MKAVGKVRCPVCGALIDITRAGKFAPHKVSGVRCRMSGRRAQTNKENK